MRRHFTSKMSRFKRTVSNASLESESSRSRSGSVSERTRSISEIVDNSKAPRVHEYLLTYLGYGWVTEPRSTKELHSGIRNVQANRLVQRSVSVTHSNHLLTVREISGDKLLESLLQNVAQVAPDDIKGSGQCLAVSFHSGHYNNQCHVFQAKTNREAADVVQAIQKACRSANKSLKSRKSAEPTFPRPKSAQGDFRLPRPRMFMEDEEELLEIKKTTNKKPISQTPSESTNHSPVTSPRVSEPMSSRWRTGRRGHMMVNEGVFTREDRMNQLASAVAKVIENNAALRDRCSKIHNPTTSFEDALYAIQTSNLEMLRNYLSCGHVSASEADHTGNTLLHYAVAVGKIESVRIICNSGLGSLEAVGWNECHALHRAVAEGNIPVMQLLLRRGVNVNGMDMMRRTPLHITCGKMELVECSIALLERGAQITATDVLGLKPCDVNPDLKEVQNRLINSACESFVASQIRDSGLVSSPSATPLSSSPTSTRPSSIISAKSHDLCISPSSKAHDLWTMTTDTKVDTQLSELLDTVSTRARALNKVYKDQNHSLTSRSHGNLMELQEKEETRRDRLKRFKFPSETQLYSNVEGEAIAVLGAVDRLQQRVRQLKDKKGQRVDSGRGLSLDFDTDDYDTLSEPNLVGVGGAQNDIPSEIPRPYSSSAVLEHSEASQEPEAHSTGTLMSQSDGLDGLEEAFDELHKEVTKTGAEDHTPSKNPSSRREKYRPSQLNMKQRKLSEQETHAIFNEIINDMTTFSDSPLSSPQVIHTPHTPSSFEVKGQPLPTKSSAVHTPESKSPIVDETKGRDLEGEAPKTVEISDTGTLKKRGKFSAVKRIGSPLTKVRRKSVSNKQDKKEEKEKLKEKFGTFRRQTTMPEIPLDQNKISAGPTAMELVKLDPLPSCEPVNTALKLMVTLSANQECRATLISYICLPKCETKLLQLAQDRSTPADMLADIATLLQNMFELGGGGEGRKNALNSGVLDLTIKLLKSRDPIPGTCLSLLNNLLVSEDDKDYLRTIIRIPTEPLLLYLDPYEPPDSDTSRRDTNVSTATSDSGMSSGKPRENSLDSELSETSNGRQAMSPVLNGEAVTNDEAKRIVLKMLAVASSHHKMQHQLSTERAIRLLADCLTDPAQQNVTNAIITLANVAQHTESHKLLIQMELVDKFVNLLSSGPRPRYHATRALVYLGKLNLLNEFSLFEATATGYNSDVVVTTTDTDGHVYARGATIEKCVEFITGDILQLWGGFHLVVGPSPTADHPLSPKATKEQVINFFLTTYQSFVRPIILMRLLLHRLATPIHPQNPFNWCSPNEASTLPHSSQHTTHTIPSTQMAVLTLIGRWLESFPDDFLQFPELQAEVNKVIKRLRPTRGPFIPHTHRLRSLMQDLSRPRNEQHTSSVEEELRVPHHDNLYQLCKQMVTGGHLPVTLDEAIFISALHLHIEDVNDPFSHIAPPSLSLTQPPKSKKGFTMQLKSSLPIGYAKTKTLLKRIRAQMENFENLSERNSKHLYIERCQSNPGYDCTFFSVKVPSGGRFKKGVQKQLLGISTKRVVFLEEKSKELLSSHLLTAVLSVSRETDPCQLVLHLRGDPTGCKVQAESAAAAREIANVLEQCREGEGMLDDNMLRDRWSDSTPSLFTITGDGGPGELDDSLSTPTSSLERGITPPPGSHDQNGHSPFETPPNQSNGATGPNKSDTLKAFTQDDSLVTDLTESHIGGTGHAPFCDCPPDPEISPEINLKHLTLTQVLSCPMEVARQMTLIAHEHFCSVTPAELLQKVNLISKPPSKKVVTKAPDSGSQSPDNENSTAIKKLAHQFNQVGNWVAHSILQYEYLDERVEAVQRFIKISKHCLDLGNISSMMAIVVAGLGSSPIRRLATTWEMVPKSDMELFKHMDSILEERNNYKSYREHLSATQTPAVPYLGVFLKDLTFICDGNPDYLRGGLINLHKRRQVYKTIEEIHHFQQDHYKLHQVSELREYLLSHQLMPADDLHGLSLTIEPRITRSTSNHGTRSLSAAQKSFFKLTRSSSASASNLHKT